MGGSPDATNSHRTLIARAQDLQEDAVARAREAHRRWPLLEYPLELTRRWVRVNASVLAGHLAFKVFVFVIPLMLLVVSGLGFAASSGVDVEDQSEQLRMGQALARTLAQSGQEAQGGRVQLGLVGLIALLSATSGLVAALRLVVATVWGVSVKDAPVNKVKTMGWMVPGVIVLLCGLAARQWLSRRGIVLEGVGALLVIAVNSLSILGLFWILPRRTTHLRDLVPGAVAAAVGFAGLNIASAVYFTDKLQKSSQVYGALGVALTFLAYFFFIGQIIVIASLVNTVWVDRAEIIGRLRAEGDADEPPGDG